MEIQNIGKDRDVYYVIFDYYFKYSVNGKEYKSSSSIKTESNSQSVKFTPPYSKGDNFTIYYNTENPQDFRRDLNYVSDTTLYIIEGILLLLVSLGLGKAIIDYKKEQLMLSK